MIKDRYLLLKGCAGLGNRLITLLKAIEYSKRANRLLYVDWSDGMFAPEGENAFYKYFDLMDVPFTISFENIENRLESGASVYPKGITFVEIKQGIYKNFKLVGTFLSRKLPFFRVLFTSLFKGKISSILGLQSFQHKIEDCESWITNIKNVFQERNVQLGAQLSKNIDRDIVVFVDFRPWVKLIDIFKHVRLKDIYYSKFLNFANQNNLINGAVGVHVRATDKSPREQLFKLFAKIDKLVTNEPSLSIFLSSDNPKIEEEFKQRYSGKIIIYPKTLPTDLNGNGIHHWAMNSSDSTIKTKMFEESLADMWILSMCKYLYWQGNSSFSLMSSLLKTDKDNIIDWMK